MYLNKAFIIGNLTKDPELKKLPSGVSVSSFSVATNKTWKDKDGTKQEKVEFHNIVVFGKQADAIHSYMKKGSQIMVDGRIETRSWDGQDGKKNYRTEIIVENFQFGNKAKPKEASPEEQERIDKHNAPDESTTTSPGFNGEEINIEDIPF